MDRPCRLPSNGAARRLSWETKRPRGWDEGQDSPTPTAFHPGKEEPKGTKEKPKGFHESTSWEDGLSQLPQMESGQRQGHACGDLTTSLQVPGAHYSLTVSGLRREGLVSGRLSHNHH